MIKIAKETTEQLNASLPVEVLKNLIKFKLEAYNIETSETSMPSGVTVNSNIWFDYISGGLSRIKEDPNFRGTLDDWGTLSEKENFNRTGYAMQMIEDILLYWKLCKADYQHQIRQQQLEHQRKD